MARKKKPIVVEPLSLGLALGAEPGVSVQCFTAYIPNKDRNSQEIGTRRLWELELIRLLKEILGGATAFPVEGGWLSPEKNIILENPVVVYSYIADPAHFFDQLPRIREFLHRLGRETNQGEIAFEFADHFFRITQFDPQESPR
jgi:hypothetical protein